MIVEDYGFGLCIKDIQSWVKKAVGTYSVDEVNLTHGEAFLKKLSI